MTTRTTPSTKAKILDHPSKRQYEFLMDLHAREEGNKEFTNQILLWMYDEDNIEKAREKHVRRSLRQSANKNTKVK